MMYKHSEEKQNETSFKKKKMLSKAKTLDINGPSPMTVKETKFVSSRLTNTEFLTIEEEKLQEDDTISDLSCLSHGQIQS